ncbi:hypothetical protein [Luteibacter sp. CQ10]|uniref:hypothetical protein n=1 Tax=Luteibacter sp. CQ10 TaxID=2805821 RepID=UPI0034A4219A
MAPDASAKSSLADLSAEGMLLAECLMTRNYDEARRSAQLLRHGARQLELGKVQRLAERVILLLGPEGADPSPGLGTAVLMLAATLEDTGTP